MTNDRSVTFLSTLFFIRGGGEEILLLSRAVR